jgi:hypothetical protein
MKRQRVKRPKVPGGRSRVVAEPAREPKSLPPVIEPSRDRLFESLREELGL